ncbi:MAG TPA: hypothetical protein VGX21_20110 [Methylomirabilota bacterium]|jgi:hypothetical protein|nr:hypothetical protein [Methylomirabilota bacterium]
MGGCAQALRVRSGWKPGRIAGLLFLLHLCFDLVDPTLPGVFRFNADQSVEALKEESARAAPDSSAAALGVRPRRAAALVVPPVARIRSATRPGGQRGPTPQVARSSLLEADPARSSEDH